MQITHSTRVATRRGLFLTATSIAVGSLTSTSQAQVLFSIDYRGPTIAVPGPAPITEGDILTPAGGGFPALAAPPPVISISGGAAGLGIPLHGGCVGHPPGIPCGVELDALSLGFDFPVPMGALPPGTYVFSVDDCSTAIPGSPMAPNLLTDFPACDHPAEVYRAMPLPPGPLPPGGPAGHNCLIDGNGIAPAGNPGTGIIEPRCPVMGAGPRPGDNLDAVDMDIAFPTTCVWFSLDAGFFDPCLGTPNSGSAMANGFLPGSILATCVAGGAPFTWLPPIPLGLDLGGAGTDDLDALALWENGVAGPQVGAGPYTWLGAAPTDMILFSVRRGSAVVGVADSLFGIPIQPGDILTPPMFAGGPPSIFIAAEWLGLATVRAGFVTPADMDALDTRLIMTPTEPGSPYCFGDGIDTVVTAMCPCANFGDPGHGCANSNALLGGAKLVATGTVFPNTIVLTCTGIPNGNLSTFLRATMNVPTGTVFGDGVRCVGSPVVRFGQQTAGVGGNPANTVAASPVSVAAGNTRYYQLHYRNPLAGFCPPELFNISNGYVIVW